MVERKRTLAHIFRTMDYNEKRAETVAPISTWLQRRENQIGSLVDGRPYRGSGGPGTGFSVGPSRISVSYLASKELGSLLPPPAQTSIPEAKPLDDKETRARLAKLEALVVGKGEELVACEALGTQIPAWQIRNFDLPTWTRLKNLHTENKRFKEDGRKVVLVHCSREGYFGVGSVLQLLAALVSEDEKSIVVLSGEEPYFLAPAYLIDAVNEAGIRKTPIDLFLLDQADPESLESLRATCRVWVWGPPGPFPTRLHSGVWPGTGRGAHYILDSASDIQTAVDSILHDVWSSGTKVHWRTRAILFVHQPAYRPLIELLEKKLGKASPDSLGHRPHLGLDRDRVKGEGVKTVPADSDFSGRTVVYEVGSSSMLLQEGQGEVLFVLPYRSSAELLSLANNWGDEAEVFLHTTNALLVKEIGGRLKGTHVYVNRSPGPSHLPRINLGLLLKKIDAPAPLAWKTEGAFTKAVQGGSKALAAWSSMERSERYAVLSRVFTPFLNKDDYSATFATLLGVSGRVNEKESVGTLVVRQYKPFGLSGLILINPEKMKTTRILMTLLTALLKGNVVLVVAVTTEKKPFPEGLLETFKSGLLPDLVHFLTAPSLAHAIAQLSFEGKVGLATILHRGEDGPPAAGIPSGAFSRLIVEDEESIDFRPESAEIGQAIYL